MNKCDHCGVNEVRVSLNMEENSLYLCQDCDNEMMSEELGVRLEQLIETFSLKDYQGVNRTFHVERHLNPMGLFLEAVEKNIEFGYKFAVHGELEDNQQVLLSTLIEKTRKSISEQHIETGIFPNGQTYETIKNNKIKGLVEYNEASKDSPIVIIDGKPFTWEDVGKMVMAFEGFQIKLQLYDRTDDVE